jgi:hypothetical protein
MQTLTPIRLGAYCAVATTITFVVAIVLMATSGVQVLIPRRAGTRRSTG